MREHPRRPGRYRVDITDGRQFLVEAEALVAAGATRAGATLDGVAVTALAEAAADTAAFDRALGWMARARRTTREITVRLRRAGVDEARGERVVRRLADRGLLDDERVAEAEAASRLRRGEAPGRVRQRLRAKGVASAVAETALREAVEDAGVDESALCLALARQRWPRLRDLPRPVATRRLAGFLQRRGFGSAVVMDAVRSVVRD